ncbi:hypothetical protein N7488_002373 [Penicillium malachiteum]|nr:hypothetical protein N7488_002373 [Penicillium malachiteum]
MSYLPPGWTLERLQTATIDDLRQIPEDCDLSLAGQFVTNANEKFALSVAYHLPPECRCLKKNDDPVVEVVERGGFDDFGFIVFRTDYSDEERWEQWLKEFQRIIDASVERASGGKKIEDKSLILTYDDEDMAGVTHEQILQAYYGYQESESIPPGLDTGMCLVVDSAVMDSITSDKPWVYALDLSFDHESSVGGEEYPGDFRVAVDSVLTELYPMLTAMTSPELWAGDDRIWESAFD